MKPIEKELNDIKTYLKIKQSAFSDNSFIEISPKSKSVTLNADIFKHLPKEVQLKYEVDKVFKDKDEYSYIYEDITLNCISNALNGINSSFFSYGETNTEKHSLLFGSNTSFLNIAERGIFPRLIESLLMKDSISVAYSLMCVHSSRLMDLTLFLGKTLTLFSAEDFITQSFEIKQLPDIINNITKVPLSSQKELNAMIKEFNALYEYFYSLEPSSSQLKLSTSSHFIYVIYIYDKANNNQLLSNISLCELSSQVTTQHLSKSSIRNSKQVIDSTYTCECLKKTLRTLKLARRASVTSIDSSTDNAKLLIVLKKLSFTSISTQFIIVGCILHNVGMHEAAKEALQFLFECKRISYEKVQLDEAEALKMEKTKDDLIFSLQARCRELATENKEMSEVIKSKNEVLEHNRELYKKQVSKLKSLFSFEGDVNVLLGGSASSKEMKSVQSIRDAVIGIGVKSLQNEKLLQEINSLKETIDVLSNQNEKIVNDQTMIKYFNSTKESNQHEQMKLKLALDNSQQMINLKEANTKLTQMNSSYKKELQSRYDIINNLSKAFDVNKEYSKTKKELKDDMRAKLEEKRRIEVRGYQVNYDKELSNITKKYEGFLREKDIQIAHLQSSYDELLSKSNNNTDKLQNELIFLYDMLSELISTFKSEFNSKVAPQLSVTTFNKFISSKDHYFKLIKSAESNINKTSLPITTGLIQGRKPKEHQRKEQRIELSPRSQCSSNQSTVRGSYDELAMELKKENSVLKKRIDDLIELVNAKDDKCHCSKKETVNGLNEKMATKLESMVVDNTRKAMVINVHERVINKLNSENMTMKEMLRKKLITEKASYPLPTSFKKASANSSLLYKAKSTRDIVTSYSYVKSQEKKGLFSESMRLFSG